VGRRLTRRWSRRDGCSDDPPWCPRLIANALDRDGIACAAQDSVHPPMAVEGFPDFATEGSFKLRPRLWRVSGGVRRG